MKINKFLALALAGAVAMTTAMSVSVSAAFKSDVASEAVSADDKNFIIDAKAAGLKPADINGATIVVSFEADATGGFNGGIVMNSKVGGWAQDEANYSWGDSGKAITAEGADGKYTLTFKVPDKAFVDEDFAEKAWAQVFVCQWWGKDITVKDVTINGKSMAAATEEKKDDTAATDDKKDDTTVTDDKKDDTTVTDDKKDDTTVTDETKVEPVAQKVTVGVTSKKLKAADLAKKAVKFKIGAKAETALTYKSNNKNVTVTKAGKVTVKKGTKKGTYKITVTAAATDAYKTAKKVVKVVVK